MTGTPPALTDLLTECDAQGIRLLAAKDGELTIDAPQNVLTPDMLHRLKTHKAELLASLQSPPARVQVAIKPESVEPAKPVCRCGSTAWRDVPIHDGQSVRRDCAKCDRFLDFPLWYGKYAGQ